MPNHKPFRDQEEAKSLKDQVNRLESQLTSLKLRLEGGIHIERDTELMLALQANAYMRSLIHMNHLLLMKSQSPLWNTTVRPVFPDRGNLTWLLMLISLP